MFPPDAVVRIKAGKAVRVVALGLQGFTGQRGERLAAVQVVAVVALRMEAEPAGGEGFDFGHVVAFEPHQAQRLPQRVGVGAEPVEHGVPSPVGPDGLIAYCVGLVQAEYHRVAHLGHFGAEEEAPTRQVDEVEAAVTAGTAGGEALQGRPVRQRKGAETYRGCRHAYCRSGRQSYAFSGK